MTTEDKSDRIRGDLSAVRAAIEFEVVTACRAVQEADRQRLALCREWLHAAVDFLQEFFLSTTVNGGCGAQRIQAKVRALAPAPKEATLSLLLASPTTPSVLWGFSSSSTCRLVRNLTLSISRIFHDRNEGLVKVTRIVDGWILLKVRICDPEMQRDETRHAEIRSIGGSYASTLVNPSDFDRLPYFPERNDVLEKKLSGMAKAAFQLASACKTGCSVSPSVVMSLRVFASVVASRRRPYLDYGGADPYVEHVAAIQTAINALLARFPGFGCEASALLAEAEENAPNSPLWEGLSSHVSSEVAISDDRMMIDMPLLEAPSTKKPARASRRQIVAARNRRIIEILRERAGWPHASSHTDQQKVEWMNSDPVLRDLEPTATYTRDTIKNAVTAYRNGSGKPAGNLPKSKKAGRQRKKFP